MLSGGDSQGREGRCRELAHLSNYELAGKRIPPLGDEGALCLVPVARTVVWMGTVSLGAEWGPPSFPDAQTPGLILGLTRWVRAGGVVVSDHTEGPRPRCWNAMDRTPCVVPLASSPTPLPAASVGNNSCTTRGLGVAWSVGGRE